MTQPATAPNGATPNPAPPRQAEPPNPPAPPPPTPDKPAAPDTAAAPPVAAQSPPPASPPPNAAPATTNAAAAPRAETAAPATAPAKPKAPRKPLPENVAAALSYLVGWVSGLVFLLIDRRPFVRAHAARSVVVFTALTVVLLILSDFFLGPLLPRENGLLRALTKSVAILWGVGAVGLMLKAATGQRPALPTAERQRTHDAA